MAMGVTIPTGRKAGEEQCRGGAHRQRTLAPSRHVPRLSHPGRCADATLSLSGGLNPRGEHRLLRLQNRRRDSVDSTQPSTEEVPKAQLEDARTQTHPDEARPRTSPTQGDVVSGIRTSSMSARQKPRDLSTRPFRMVSWLVWQGRRPLRNTRREAQALAASC